MESKNIRSFFAISVSSDCRQEINKIILDLRRDFPSVIKWVNTDNLHLTLKFLGEFKSGDIQQIEKMLRPVLSLSAQFDLTFQNLGVFPNERKPKVVWIGLSYPDELKLIFQKIENIALELGYPKEERGFSPHLTIGRVKFDASDLLKIGAIIKNKKVGEVCQSHVGRVIFYQSYLTSTGPVYSELFHLPLKE
jgi:2'-5' RNA ligase